MQFISNYPWYYLLLCLLAGFIVSGLLYYRDKKKRGDSLGTREADKRQFLKILKENGLR